MPAGATFDDFCKALAGWDITPLHIEGEVIGAVMTKGDEIHVGYKGSPRASIRGHIRKTLNRLIGLYGHAVTKVAQGNELGLRFCERLGFVKTGSDGQSILMRCEKVTYA